MDEDWLQSEKYRISQDRVVEWVLNDNGWCLVTSNGLDGFDEALLHSLAAVYLRHATGEGLFTIERKRFNKTAKPGHEVDESAPADYNDEVCVIWVYNDNDRLGAIEKACQRVLLGRRRLFRKSHALYRDSMLLMDICNAQKKPELAEAYEADLSLEAPSETSLEAPPVIPSLDGNGTPKRSSWLGLRKSQK